MRGRHSFGIAQQGVDLDNPLTKADLTKIKEALYKLNELNGVLDLLDRIGVDTNEMREKQKFYLTTLQTIRTELFPTTP
jgi:hypothetical protein